MVVQCDTPEMSEKVKKIFSNSPHQVRELNFNNPDKSNAWNFMKAITGDGAEDAATIIAKTILMNCTDKTSIYLLFDEPLLTALLLRIAMDDGSTFPESKKNFSSVYEIFNQAKGDDYLTELFNPKTVPESAKVCLTHYQQFTAASPNLRANVFSRLAVAFQFMANKPVAGIFSNDDIDITLPSRAPCLYIIQQPDTHDLFKPYVALFINMMVHEISKMHRVGRLSTPIRFVLTAFSACGVFPSFGGLVMDGNKHNMSFLISSHSIQNITGSLGEKEEEWEYVFDKFSVLLSAGNYVPEGLKCRIDDDRPVTFHESSIMDAVNGAFTPGKRVSFKEFFISVGENEITLMLKGKKPMSLRAEFN